MVSSHRSRLAEVSLISRSLLAAIMTLLSTFVQAQ